MFVFVMHHYAKDRIKERLHDVRPERGGTTSEVTSSNREKKLSDSFGAKRTDEEEKVCRNQIQWRFRTEPIVVHCCSCLLSLTQMVPENKNKEKKRNECRKPLVSVERKESPPGLKKRIQIARLGSSHVGGIMFERKMRNEEPEKCRASGHDATDDDISWILNEELDSKPSARLLCCRR